MLPVSISMSSVAFLFFGESLFTFIWSFLFVIGVLIFVHELGHFLAAKAVGIGVSRFSIGLGPATPLRFVRGETTYIVAWIPLGGYVKMASREEQEMIEALEGGEVEAEFPPEKLFENKPLWARILVISAGVIMNVLFAWGVHTGMAGIYGRELDTTVTLQRVDTERLPAAAAALAQVPSGTRIVSVGGEPVETWNAIWAGVIDPKTDSLEMEFAGGVAPVSLAIPGTDVEARSAIAEALQPFREARVVPVPGGEAIAAGMLEGDLILGIDGVAIATWEDMVRQVEANAGREMVFEIERQGLRQELAFSPRPTDVTDSETGEVSNVGRIGVLPKRPTIISRFGPMESVVEGAKETWEDASLILFGLRALVTGRVSPREVGGPIMIGSISAQVARTGFRSLLLLMALISVNLAILNLLPIPVLDGGHLLFLFAEGLRGGRPLSLELRHRLTQFGFVVLLLIMGWALTSDLLRVAGL